MWANTVALPALSALFIHNIKWMIIPGWKFSTPAGDLYERYTPFSSHHDGRLFLNSLQQLLNSARARRRQQRVTRKLVGR
jgi:hypothetical protein